MTKKNETPVVAQHIRLEIELHEKLKALADSEKRSMSNMCNLLLSEALEHRKKS